MINYGVIKNMKRTLLQLVGRVLLAALFVFPMASIHADTTFVNVDLVPTGTLTGTVLLSGQSTHNGIIIYVSGTNIVGASDVSGNYTIVGVPYGTYTLTATKAGYLDEIIPGVTVTSAGQVVTVATKTLSPNADTETRMFGDALRQYSYNDYSGAIVSLRALITANPSGQYAAAAQYRVGLAFSQLNENDSAIAAMTDLITTYPSDSLVPDAYYWRGVYKDNKLDHSGALADFQFIIANYSSSPIASRAQYRLGRVYEALNDYTQAINAYHNVESNFPSSPDIAAAIYNVAWIYYTHDVYDSAIIEYNKLLTNYSTTDEAAKASYYKGMSYYNQENLTQAVTEFNSSITNYPAGSKIVDAWYYRTLCKYDLESYTYLDAKADFQSIITNFPSSDRVAHSRYYLGSCEYALGNTATAISLYQDFLASEPNNDWVPNAYYKIASAYYFGANDYTNALNAYTTYYNLYPDGKQAGEAHYWAGRCQERLGFDALAVDEYCIVITSYPNCSKVADAISRRDGLGVTTCP